MKNDRYIVNGAHDAAKLQDMLDIFIRKCVLCERCDNPETVLKVLTKKGIITASCKACGHSFTVDMRHKLTTFMIKNPPETSLNDQGTSLTQRKEKRSRRKDGRFNKLLPSTYRRFMITKSTFKKIVQKKRTSKSDVRITPTFRP